MKFACHTLCRIVLGLVASLPLVTFGLINGQMTGIEVEGVTLERPSLELGTIGGNVTLTVDLESETAPLGPVFVTVLRNRGGINMPVVTRQQDAESAGRSQYKATFSLELDTARGPTAYELMFWSTANIDGQDTNLSLGRARLTVYPEGYLDFLRRLSLRHPFVVDRDSAPRGLENFLSLHEIGFTRARRSELGSLADQSLFFTARPTSVPAMIYTAIIGGEQPAPLIERNAEGGGRLVMPGKRWAGLGVNANLQVELARAVETMVGQPVRGE